MSDDDPKENLSAVDKIYLIKKIYDVWAVNPDRSQGQHSEPCMYDIGKILAS